MRDSMSAVSSDKAVECTYPKCNCPFDAPADPNWCARGYPKAAATPPPTREGRAVPSVAEMALGYLEAAGYCTSEEVAHAREVAGNPAHPLHPVAVTEAMVDRACIAYQDFDGTIQSSMRAALTAALGTVQRG
jgi:hypothetical protein